jgi:succinate dehydrogenase / fumarate reductase, flavoprotein subunit
VLDARNAVLAAEATLRGAAERRESRGAHVRSDHPDPDEAYRVRIAARLDGDDLALTRVPVPPVPDVLASWVASPGEMDMTGRLLE